MNIFTRNKVLFDANRVLVSRLRYAQESEQFIRAVKMDLEKENEELRRKAKEPLRIILVDERRV